MPDDAEPRGRGRTSVHATGGGAPTDCCIIGGGVVGLSIARELAGRGLSVRVLARDDPQATSSWAAAGIFPPAPVWATAPANARLTAWSDRLHRQWTVELRDETGIDNELQECGGLHLARSTEAIQRLRGVRADWLDRGARCEWLDGAGVSALEPALADAFTRGHIVAGFLLPEEQRIRPPRHLAALERSCRARGVEIARGAAVGAIETSGGRASGVRVDGAGGGATIRAGCYVLAAGAWSGPLGRTLDLRVETRPIRGQIVLLALGSQVLGRVVNRGLEYLVPRPDGRLLVGSTLEDAGFTATATADVVAHLRGFAEEMLGALSGSRVERVWAGLRPGSLDGLPTIGPVPGLDNVFVAAGHFRAGLHQSTGTAVMIADLVEGRRPEMDATPFAADRRAASPGPDSVAAMLARVASERP